MQKFLVILLLTVCAVGQAIGGKTTVSGTTGVGAQACGSLLGDASCGYVGNAYATEFGGTQSGFQTGATALAVCNNTLTAGTRYYLTANIGADDTADCLKNVSGGNVQIDLNGFTVTGRVRFTSNPNAMAIFNGTVNCTDVNYCVGSGTSATSAVTEAWRIHHLTGKNSYSTGSNFINVQTDPASNAGSIASGKIYNVTSRYFVSTGARNANVYVIANELSFIEIYDNKFTCDEDVEVCQGAVLFDSSGFIDRNLIDTPTNVVAGDDARGAVCDGTPMAANLCHVRNNKFLVYNNKAIRYRNRIGTVTGNLFLYANNTVHGVIHIYDNSAAAQADYTGLNIFANTFIAPTGGIMVYGRGGSNARIYDNYMLGAAAGQLAFFQSFGTGAFFSTTATFCRNPEFSAVANIKADNVSADTTVLTAYLSGPTDASGDGTVNQVGSCPF